MTFDKVGVPVCTDSLPSRKSFRDRIGKRQLDIAAPTFAPSRRYLATQSRFANPSNRVMAIPPV